jgi:hypothetical protein
MATFGALVGKPLPETTEVSAHHRRPCLARALGGASLDFQVLVNAGEGQNASGKARCAGDPKPAANVSQMPARLDERSRAARVAERQSREVEHNRPLAVEIECADGLEKQVGVGDVQLPRDLHDRSTVGIAHVNGDE